MNKRLLIVGDLIALLILTAIGFTTHGETDASFLPRAGAMFVSLVSGWFLLAPAMGLFDTDRIQSPRGLWRPALTALFAAQFAVTLRGLLLQSSVQPIFSVVLGFTSALGMLVWRWIASQIEKRRGA